jgi:hypothetical protein
MKTPILAMALTAVALPLAATPADAQRGYNERRELRECNRELRRADSRREYIRELRECRRELRRARRDDWRTYSRYDWNRPRYGSTYYANDYYRDGRYYRERRLTRGDRIYVGNDGRYYCRRSDGTTGLIVGAAVGGLIGNSLDRGRSSLLGTLIGAGAGAAIGREIERGNVRCR